MFGAMRKQESFPDELTIDNYTDFKKIWVQKVTSADPGKREATNSSCARQVLIAVCNTAERKSEVYYAVAQNALNKGIKRMGDIITGTTTFFEHLNTMREAWPEARSDPQKEASMWADYREVRKAFYHGLNLSPNETEFFGSYDDNHKKVITIITSEGPHQVDIANAVTHARTLVRGGNGQGIEKQYYETMASCLRLAARGVKMSDAATKVTGGGRMAITNVYLACKNNTGLKFPLSSDERNNFCAMYEKMIEPQRKLGVDLSVKQEFVQESGPDAKSLFNTNEQGLDPIINVAFLFALAGQTDTRDLTALGDILGQAKFDKDQAKRDLTQLPGWGHVAAIVDDTIDMYDGPLRFSMGRIMHQTAAFYAKIPGTLGLATWMEGLYLWTGLVASVDAVFKSASERWDSDGPTYRYINRGSGAPSKYVDELKVAAVARNVFGVQNIDRDNYFRVTVSDASDDADMSDGDRAEARSAALQELENFREDSYDEVKEWMMTPQEHAPKKKVMPQQPKPKPAPAKLPPKPQPQAPMQPANTQLQDALAQNAALMVQMAQMKSMMGQQQSQMPHQWQQPQNASSLPYGSSYAPAPPQYQQAAPQPQQTPRIVYQPPPGFNPGIFGNSQGYSFN